jgi:hypothetical protein
MSRSYTTFHPSAFVAYSGIALTLAAFLLCHWYKILERTDNYFYEVGRK